MPSKTINYISKGEVTIGVITHVEDDGKSFWMIRQENVEKEIEELREFCKCITFKKILFPDVNEKFIINWQNVYLRAIRIDDINDKIRIFFQDTGELITLNVNKAFQIDFYEIPKKLMEYPPLAQKCKWSENSIEGENSDKHEFLSSKMYQKLVFEVLETNPENLVNVWLFDENEFFHRVLKINNQEKIRTLSQPNEISDVEEEDEDSDDDTILVDNELCNTSNTSNQWESLFKDTPTTSNPCIAIQGFETKDDSEYCKFYNPQTGYCFKGANCKKIHLPPLEDGFECRDKKEISFGISKITQIPVFFKTFEITITHFNKLNHFTCVFKSNIQKLKELTSMMNSEKEVHNYKPFSYIPSYHEHLIFKDKNGKFYRVKILETSDNSNQYSVKLLDVGKNEKASINQLFEWCDRFNDVDFLAIEMNVVNFVSVEDKEQEAIEEIFKIQRENGFLKALVVGFFGEIECILYDMNEKDISEHLIAKGLVTKKEHDTVSCFKNIKVIPG